MLDADWEKLRYLWILVPGDSIFRHLAECVVVLTMAHALVDLPSVEAEGFSVSARNIIPACGNLISAFCIFMWGFLSDLTGSRFLWVFIPLAYGLLPNGCVLSAYRLRSTAADAPGQQDSVFLAEISAPQGNSLFSWFWY